MSTAPETYWRDFIEDLGDPEFLRVYIAESHCISTFNQAADEMPADQT